jgi:hypothetical protein
VSRPALVAVLAAILAALVAGCGVAASPASSSPPVAGPTASSVAPSAWVPSASIAATGSAGSAPPSSDASPAAVDPSLLAVLPAAVDGRPIVETLDAEHASAAEPSVARAAEALAMGYVSSAAGTDWAVVSVVRLRPGAWSDAFFRDWRDTYDAGVCASQGGVGGNASATIGGREVAIATCGALRTYQVHLPGPGLLVAVASAGDGRYGERVVAGLRP